MDSVTVGKLLSGINRIFDPAGYQGILLVSLELDEVMQLSDRILVIYEGQIVADLDPKAITVQELGLYMAGARKQGKESK